MRRDPDDFSLLERRALDDLGLIDTAPKVEDYLNNIDYREDADYVPSTFALEFVNTIKLINDSTEENQTPVAHYRMLDTLMTKERRIANLCARGMAKTTVFAEYLILYLALYGELPGFGKVTLALYVSDSIDNGVKSLRRNLEHRWENSKFLQEYVPEIRFTDVRWEFRNKEEHKLVVRGFGAKALALDTRLYTETGYTTIGQCAIGDRIFGPDGRLTTITAKSEIFDKAMFALTLADGRTLKVSEDHINSVVVKELSNGPRYYEQDFTTRELLKLPLRHVRQRRQHRSGMPYEASERLLFVRNPAPLEYPHAEFSVEPYTLGVVLGDGRICKPHGSVELTAHEDDWPTYRREIASVFGKGRNDSRHPRTRTESIRGLGPALRALGLVVRGSEKFLPECYFFGSVSQRLALLQGLMDTDGTVGLTGRTVFCSTSPRLLADTERLVRSLGGSARRSAKPFCTEIWLNLPMFRLARKLNRQRFNRRADLTAIEAIVPIADEPSQCIAVDNACHQFLAGEYVRTHNTGVRGTKEMGRRPQLAILDDLISDEDARSDTVIAAVEDTVHKAVTYALHPAQNLIIWSGTPFNARDPLYKAIESGAWKVNVFPICEAFPCKRDEFRSAWPDRFTYEYVSTEYRRALALGRADTFNQELLLRIMSEEERMVQDADIQWYRHELVLQHKARFNFYITTDFATSVKQRADFSVISVWAYNNNGDWFWVDGVLERQLINKSMDDLFRFVAKYRPMQTGIEVSGQQQGLIAWIQEQMLIRNTFFTLASDQNSNQPGIRPNTNKLVRFNSVLPLFKQKKIFFPVEKKNDPILLEAVNELSLIAVSGMRAKQDDFIDTVSMLGSLQPWKPSEEQPMVTEDSNIWAPEPEPEEPSRLSSYIV